MSYDVESDKTDPGYPADIAGHWTGFPAEFNDGVDAGVVWTNGKAYFFKGSQFVRFDLADRKSTSLNSSHSRRSRMPSSA